MTPPPQKKKKKIQNYQNTPKIILDILRVF